MTERKLGLSRKEKINLRRGVPTLRQEGDISPKGLPPVSEVLREQLLTFLNLNGSSTVSLGQSQQIGEVHYTPLSLASQMVLDEFGTLMKNCEYQTIPIRNWVNKQFKDSANSMNSAAIGAALVVKVYHMMFGEALIDGFSKLNPIDVINALDDEARIPEERYSLMNIAARTYRIPSHQFNLEYCLTQLAMCSPNAIAVLDGGTAIFRVLDRFAQEMGLVK